MLPIFFFWLAFVIKQGVLGHYPLIRQISWVGAVITPGDSVTYVIFPLINKFELARISKFWD